MQWNGHMSTPGSTRMTLTTSSATRLVRALRCPYYLQELIKCVPGTAAGDPTESNWVGDRFGRRADELIVGSVKGNVGCVITAPSFGLD